MSCPDSGPLMDIRPPTIDNIFSACEQMIESIHFLIAIFTPPFHLSVFGSMMFAMLSQI